MARASLRASRQLTLEGQLVGTPHYMSPEQVDGETSRYDERSDVYGLGATLYALLVGAPPFADHAQRGLTLLGFIGVLSEQLADPPAQDRRIVGKLHAAGVDEIGFRRGRGLCHGSAFHIEGKGIGGALCRG